MNLYLTLLIVYSAALVAIGVSIARLVKGSADFFVAGRALTAPLLFSTVLASNIGAGATIGATGRGYFDGVSAWWWNGSSAIGSIFLAFFIGPRIWRAAKDHNLLTTGDFLEMRYGALVRGLVSSLICSPCSSSPVTTSQPKARTSGKTKSGIQESRSL